MKKKLLAMALATAMTVSMAACGAGDGGDGSGVSITIFNSKVEIQDQFEEMAREYSEATGVNVEVYYSGDTVAAHMATAGDEFLQKSLKRVQGLVVLRVKLLPRNTLDGIRVVDQPPGLDTHRESHHFAVH